MHAVIRRSFELAAARKQVDALQQAQEAEVLQQTGTGGE